VAFLDEGTHSSASAISLEKGASRGFAHLHLPLGRRRLDRDDVPAVIVEQGVDTSARPSAPSTALLNGQWGAFRDYLAKRNLKLAAQPVPTRTHDAKSEQLREAA
jgi:hypothetical protein